MMGLRVFTAIRLLNSVVEVGLVVGVTPAITQAVIKGALPAYGSVLAVADPSETVHLLG